MSCNVNHIICISSAECVADLALVVDSSGSIRDSNVDGRTDNYDFVLAVSETLHFPAGVLQSLKNVNNPK